MQASHPRRRTLRSSRFSQTSALARISASPPVRRKELRSTPSPIVVHPLAPTQRIHFASTGVLKAWAVPSELDGVYGSLATTSPLLSPLDAPPLSRPSHRVPPPVSRQIQHHQTPSPSTPIQSSLSYESPASQPSPQVPTHRVHARPHLSADHQSWPGEGTHVDRESDHSTFRPQFPFQHRQEGWTHLSAEAYAPSHPFPHPHPPPQAPAYQSSSPGSWEQGYAASGQGGSGELTPPTSSWDGSQHHESSPTSASRARDVAGGGEWSVNPQHLDIRNSPTQDSERLRYSSGAQMEVQRWSSWPEPGACSSSPTHQYQHCDPPPYPPPSFSRSDRLPEYPSYTRFDHSPMKVDRLVAPQETYESSVRVPSHHVSQGERSITSTPPADFHQEENYHSQILTTGILNPTHVHPSRLMPPDNAATVHPSDGYHFERSQTPVAAPAPAVFVSPATIRQSRTPLLHIESSVRDDPAPEPRPTPLPIAVPTTPKRRHTGFSRRPSSSSASSHGSPGTSNLPTSPGRNYPLEIAPAEKTQFVAWDRVDGCCKEWEEGSVENERIEQVLMMKDEFVRVWEIRERGRMVEVFPWTDNGDAWFKGQLMASKTGACLCGFSYHSSASFTSGSFKKVATLRDHIVKCPRTDRNSLLFNLARKVRDVDSCRSRKRARH